MTDHEASRRHARTTPSEAVGESGDREARQQADDAVVQRSGAAEGGADAGGHRAKRQRPGMGREEQIQPHDERRANAEDG